MCTHTRLLTKDILQFQQGNARIMPQIFDLHQSIRANRLTNYYRTRKFAPLLKFSILINCVLSTHVCVEMCRNAVMQIT